MGEYVTGSTSSYVYLLILLHLCSHAHFNWYTVHFKLRNVVVGRLLILPTFLLSHSFTHSAIVSEVILCICLILFVTVHQC